MLTITFEKHFVDAEGFDVWEEVTLVGKYEVCDRCRGEGRHVNPSIDGNGLTAEDFAEDPEFAERYFEGVYDVRCEECNGDRVVAVLDEEANDPELVAAYWARVEELLGIDAEDRYWARMESGGYY